MTAVSKRSYPLETEEMRSHRRSEASQSYTPYTVRADIRVTFMTDRVRRIILHSQCYRNNSFNAKESIIQEQKHFDIEIAPLYRHQARCWEFLQDCEMFTLQGMKNDQNVACLRYGTHLSERKRDPLWRILFLYATASKNFRTHRENTLKHL